MLGFTGIGFLSLLCLLLSPTTAQASCPSLPDTVGSRTIIEVKQEFNGLADSWDYRTLRHEDLAAGSLRDSTPQAGEGAWTHRNTYTIISWLRLAFKGLQKGSNAGGEVSLDGSRRIQEAMLSVSAVFWRSWNRIAETWSNRSQHDSDAVTYIRRHHDATPMYLGFGAMQERLMPQARYLRPIAPDRDTGYTRWVPCSFSDFKLLHSRAKPRAGILEVFAQEAEVTTSQDTANLPAGGEAANESDMNLDRIWHCRPNTSTQRRTYPPQILSRNNASCIHCALDGPNSFNMHFSVKRMKEMASSGLVLCDEIPDACKANRRHKAFLASELEQEDNVLFNEHAFCTVHYLHNAVTKTIRESDFIGHLHAVQTVTTITQRQNHIHAALRHVISTELEIVAGTPPPKFNDQTTFVLEHLIFRQQDAQRC